MSKYYFKTNDYLEGWDVNVRRSIHTEDGYEDETLATFYNRYAAICFVNMMNSTSEE